MAKTAGGTSDWTAAIIAILATALIGGAVPVALYYALYVPKTVQRAEAEKKQQAQEMDWNVLIAHQAKVKQLEDDGELVAEQLKALESAAFAEPDPEKLDVPAARVTLLRLAERHRFSLRPERAQQLGAEIVYVPGGERITFENGLKATRLNIEAQATYHDFARFVVEMETLKDFVVIPESLTASGDSTHGSRHVFRMVVHVIERRNIDAIGK